MNLLTIGLSVLVGSLVAIALTHLYLYYERLLNCYTTWTASTDSLMAILLASGTLGTGLAIAGWILPKLS